MIQASTWSKENFYGYMNTHRTTRIQTFFEVVNIKGKTHFYLKHCNLEIKCASKGYNNKTTEASSLQPLDSNCLIAKPHSKTCPCS